MRKVLVFFLSALTILTAVFCLSGCSEENEIEISSKSDLDGKIIGVQAGTTGEIFVNEEIAAKKVSSYKYVIDAALALKNGAIDVIVIDEIPAREIVKNNPDFVIVDADLVTDEYAIAVKKGNIPLLKSINETIEKIKSDGIYEKLVNAFMPVDGKITIPSISDLGLDVSNKNTDGIIRLGTEAGFPPFEYIEGSEIVGFDICIGDIIASDFGKKLKIVDMSFDSLIAALQSDAVDFVAAGMTETEERRKNVDFSLPYYSSKQVVIVSQEKLKDSDNFFTAFNDVMISRGRWKLIPEGLFTTLLIAFCAIIIGTILGCIFALFRISKFKTLKFISQFYTTLIRGIPMATQLMIFYFVIFSPLGVRNTVLVAIIAFGINSGAYCTEIFRSGIQGVDIGQMEAGRSLGLNWAQTMWKIILPQGFKTILPTFTSEFITLIKETSVASFIAVVDLQKACDNIRNATYNAWIPLLSCAAVYLILTLGLTKLFAVIEKRFSKSDKRS